MYQFLAAVGNSTGQIPDQMELGLGGDVIAAAIAVLLIIILVLVVVIALTWITYDAAKAADPANQTMKPGLVWLTIVPLFVVYWNFIALPAVSNSLAATARDKGKDVGDAGRSIGMAVCYLSVVVYVLWGISELAKSGASGAALGGLYSLAAFVTFVLHIVYVVQVRRAKRVIVNS